MLALALCMRWGQRIPALLIAGPIWLGVGLLAPIALGVPVGLAAQALAGGSPAPADNGLQGWAYACVAMILWSVGGRAWGGPAGFDTVTQRTFLVATGILVLAGAIAAVAPVRNRVLIFLGTGVAVTGARGDRPAHRRSY